MVYALIAPSRSKRGQEVSIVASVSAYESEERTFAPADRTFAAGHITPINYNIPAAAEQLTQLVFTLTETGVNTLGEAINTFTVTAPEWLELRGRQSEPIRSTSRARATYTVRFRAISTNPTQEMPGFQVTYDSEHALLTETLHPAGGNCWRRNRVAAFRVPYLF